VPDEEFRGHAEAAIKEFSRRELNPGAWNRVARNTFYVTGGYDERAAFDRLHTLIQKLETQAGRELQSLFYISTPPAVFRPIIENLGASDWRSATLARSCSRKP